ISVGFDEQAALDAGTSPFVRSYLEFLAKSWGVHLNFESVPSGAALNALANGKIDLVVASTAALGFDNVSFFDDSSKKTWSFFVNPDKGYEEALRRFLVSTVNGGEYASFYRDAFGRPPSYDSLRPVLFPK